MIDILLATYNGEAYLPEQIDSLFSQTFKDWRLIIRDDGSTDTTVSFIEYLAKEFPGKVLVIQDDLGNLGAAQSFSRLLEVSDAPYVAFCDQDDIWVDNKLELQMNEMLSKEKELGAEVPILIHSDLIVVGHNLRILSTSFWKYQKLNPEKMNSLNKLLVQNFVTGCTCLLNKKLIELSKPIHQEAIMHDWWVALLAISNGSIINIATPTVYYRQHGENDVGAKAWGVRYIYDLLFHRFSSIKNSLLVTRSQADALMRNLSIDENDKKIISAYVSLFKVNCISRYVLCIKYGFKKYGFIRNLGFFLFI